MNHYFFFLLVILVLCVASSNSTKVVEVNDICKESFQESFCSKLLKSRPGGAKGVDLRVVLLRRKKHYDTCLLDLGPVGTSASVHLTDADISFKRGDYKDMAASTALLVQNILHCRNDRKDYYYYYDYGSDKALFTNYVEVVLQTSKILDIIATYLNLG
ncbi:unnamed protein product [Vicia faba]|uniref:Pectinesterase inhibitor domain-containing protein n=1 Tax=Vicia faba TaxID=3906 RepID=A0AAV0ZAZ4_VICFA|nr:unnamed protein product [Vicia faba]